MVITVFLGYTHKCLAVKYDLQLNKYTRLHLLLTKNSKSQCTLFSILYQCFDLLFRNPHLSWAFLDQPEAKGIPYKRALEAGFQ